MSRKPLQHDESRQGAQVGAACESRSWSRELAIDLSQCNATRGISAGQRSHEMSPIANLTSLIRSRELESAEDESDGSSHLRGADGFAHLRGNAANGLKL